MKKINEWVHVNVHQVGTNVVSNKSNINVDQNTFIRIITLEIGLQTEQIEKFSYLLLSVGFNIANSSLNVL